MTTDLLDCEAMNVALDLDPSDQDTRRVLADWYEEDGDAAMADGLRWMAENGRYAVRLYGEWSWWSFRAAGHPASLPLWVHRQTTNPSNYPSRRAAEESLCRALAKHDEKERNA